MDDTTRRRTVLAAGAATLAGGVLSGCGSDSGSGGSDGAAGAGGNAGAGAPAGGGGQALGETSEIPVGGGKVFKDQKVVVTQPAAGEFKAFSATCTHQGCSVASVTDGHIVCPCHQSHFKIEDGAVAGGPANRPLPAAKITIDGTKISLG
ncbi:MULTISPECIES: Rieske (2Fe-2S) protein [unclassified Streptomyces]|uniref:Rieske (2Fe-2S) protein n=1 Tax=unclassified Streptomyces TaxID=2593676 RepID=UPI001BE64FAF|nr:MULTISPECIES: Rieske (2Fe-2S) protein [unclassified Streptomyces]MBT2408106.1 Rieske (2Fe-2S) protein [Streptomyces sp. ISL-21]MBT2455618.1 Rieske (2Fe-2S) protein [Streptomyces sp. ISL-86]MBT2609556.1 Rieske (2Fe-2S) protein [Streptomyces sp. ISL-87]